MPNCPSINYPLYINFPIFSVILSKFFDVSTFLCDFEKVLNLLLYFSIIALFTVAPFYEEIC